MKEKLKIIRKLYENELPIFAVGILSRLPKKYPASVTSILRMSDSEGMHVCRGQKKPGSLPAHPPSEQDASSARPRTYPLQEGVTSDNG
jgi:hypothetical protein